MFTNDNGGQTVQSFADNYPLRGRKGEVYEGGIRVPMIMMWKGKIKPGTTSNVPVTTLDLLPTFLNASGDQPSKYPELQGSDLIKLLNAPAPERTFYWDIGYDNGAIRTGKWKMTFLPGKTPELYNLSVDLAEANNVYNQYPDLAKRLKQNFSSWKKTLPAPGWVPVSKSKQEED